MDNVLEGTTVTRMLADYRVVLDKESVRMIATILKYGWSASATDPGDRDVFTLLGDAFSGCENVVLSIPMDIPGDDGHWTADSRNLVCKLEEYGAEVL
jgi:hypothetical protein